MLVGILVFASIAVLIMSTIVSGAVSNIELTERLTDKEKAFQIAEAGVDYYRWHLAHASQDFQDGTGKSGPYVPSIL